jgi:hypothetical protein
VVETDGPVTRHYRNVSDMGRIDDHVWFRLVPMSPEPCSVDAHLHLSCTDIDTIAHNKERARLKRRLVHERNRCLQRPAPPMMWDQPTVPACPSTFDVLPHLPDVLFLSILDGHPRDARLLFYADTHTYLIDGRRSNGSVTGLIHEYAHPFEEDTIIHKMISGSKWPRVGYLAHSRFNAIVDRLLDLAETPHLVALLQADVVCEEDLCAAVRSEWAISMQCQMVLDMLAMTPPEIKAAWETNRVQASNAGTWMHWCFEAWLNRVPIPEVGPEFRLFLQFISTLGDLKAFRTEWTIFGDEEWLAGSIDFIAERSNQTLVIFDWKRSKGLRGKYTNRFQQMKPPFDQLPDCQGMHYRVQLNAYKYLIEKYYGRVVSAMYVVCEALITQSMRLLL